MKLLDEIIEGAVSDTQSIGTVLRKCLVLERQAKNEKFRIWLNNELDGYDNIDELPDYRTINSISRRFFVGYAGSQISDQPLALHVMEEKHRKLVDKLRLAQPAASYEGRPDKSADGSLPWPPSLTTKYQKKFIENFVLNRAWQEVPGSCMVGLVETVRNRVLRFALDIKDQLGEDQESVAQLPAETVEKSVINNIYGGNVFIAAHAETISQVAHTNIVAGDASENLIDWKRSMVEAGLRPKTIQDAKLAPLRAILLWGVQNKLIPLNPARIAPLPQPGA
jgi:AbiTii